MHRYTNTLANGVRVCNNVSVVDNNVAWRLSLSPIAALESGEFRRRFVAVNGQPTTERLFRRRSAMAHCSVDALSVAMSVSRSVDDPLASGSIWPASMYIARRFAVRSRLVTAASVILH